MIRSQTSPLVTICLPFSRNVRPEWSMSLASIIPPMNATLQLIHTLDVEPTPQKRAESRQYLLEKAVSNGSKFAFFKDDDVTVPPNILRALLFEIENRDDDVAIIGGIYCTKTMPAMPLVYKHLGDGPFYKWKLREVFEIELIATGMMLVHLDRIKDIPKPWFKEISHDADEAKRDGLIPEDYKGHDFSVNDDGYFCHKVRQAGLKILAHGGVLGMHWQDNGEAFILPPESYPIKTEIERKFPEATNDADEYLKRLMSVYKSVYGYSELIAVEPDLAKLAVGA